MKARAVVPQKALSGAKSRLEGALSAADRAALSLALLAHVCAALKASPDVEDVVVMTPDPAARRRAGALGVRTLSDPRPGLNAALEQTLADGRAACAVLVVAADLPLLQPADVAALLAAAGPGRLVVAPSKEGIGTNALVIPAGARFRPAYGEASLPAHRAEAHRRGYAVVEVRRPGLAFDLDTEADLLAVRYGETLASLASAAGALRFGWRYR